MYICLSCGEVFDEPVCWEEKHGLDCGPYEEWSGCPNCYGDYDYAVECSECGKVVAEEDSYDDMCEECFNRLEELEEVEEEDCG